MSPYSILDFVWCNPNIVDTPFTLIFRMWQRGCYLPFSLKHRPIHWVWQDVTMQPIDCRMCKTKHHWHSVDTDINHIKTAFVNWICVSNQSYTHYWHPILYFYTLLSASSSFVTSQFLINSYPRYLSERWCGHVTFPRFRPAIYGM